MHTLIADMMNGFEPFRFDTTTTALRTFSKEDSYDDLNPLFMSIAENAENDSELYGSGEHGYVGRGMMNRECWAIRTSNIVRVIEVAAQHGVTGAKYESLGLQYVVYWPHITFVAP